MISAKLALPLGRRTVHFPPSLVSNPRSPLISSRASSLVRVIFSCRQDEGRRDWLCLTSRCEQRTLVGSPCPFLPLPLLLPLGRSHWLALVM